VEQQQHGDEPPKTGTLQDEQHNGLRNRASLFLLCEALPVSSCVISLSLEREQEDTPLQRVPEFETADATAQVDRCVVHSHEAAPATPTWPVDLHTALKAPQL
jgi:hypothetical protein